ncbi:hypothetical protein BN1723_013598 [Verticillium longisporum]|nr:hypothetical protein BN1723_013598 [Verticillium longisporum]
MAQGAIKSSSRPAPTGKPKQTTKKQSKVNKPQKAKANSAADKLQKKYCAGLITKTEKMLGERAGHLELIGKGKKADKSEKDSCGVRTTFGNGGQDRFHDRKARKMAQGAIKSSSRPAPTGKPKQTTKKQSKVNKPQKAKANSAADKLQKKYCAGLITKTEKMLGERAGHLELIGKGKKADKSEKGLNKGGSRRYG